MKHYSNKKRITNTIYNKLNSMIIVGSKADKTFSCNFFLLYRKKCCQLMTQCHQLTTFRTTPSHMIEDVLHSLPQCHLVYQQARSHILGRVLDVPLHHLHDLGEIVFRAEPIHQKHTIPQEEQDSI